MVDHEVENTLREIRERVLAESRSRAEDKASPPAGQSLTPDGEALARETHDGPAVAARVSELHARLAESEARFDGARARLAASVEQLRAEQGALSVEQQARAAELQSEIRERIEHLLEEQRVSFKQLSLEATEAAVMQDRARRHIEAQIEALEKAVNREP